MLNLSFSVKNSLQIRIFIYVFFILLLALPLSSHTDQDEHQPIQSTSPDQRMQWFEMHMAMKKSSAFNKLKWNFIGPDNISGRLTDVDVNPDRTRTIYAASASGGVWKTDNAGTTWKPVLENAPSTSIGDVTIAPSDPKTIWVGTGEANILRSSQAGAGVFKSTDGGNSWTHMGLTGTHTIPRIIIHPNNPDIVYIAAGGHAWTDNPERGVYRSKDGGLNWKKVLYVDERTGAIDLAMSPDDLDELYAATWQRVRRRWSDPQNEKDYSGSGIYKTTDGGESWIPINAGLPPAELRGRIGLAPSPADPDVVFIILDNQKRLPHAKKRRLNWGRPAESFNQPYLKGVEIYRSENRGAEWVKVSAENLSDQFMYPGINWFNYCFTKIRTHPTEKDTIFILGVRLMKSIDGGKSFKNITYPGLHVDHHALWIDPSDPDYMVSGNDGGLNITYDGGKTWLNFHTNLPVSQFYSVAVDMQNPFTVYASPQDHGNQRGPVSSRPGLLRSATSERISWENAPGGEYQYVAIDPTDPDVYYSGNLQKHIWNNGTWKSETLRPDPYVGDVPLRRQCLAPFLLSPHNPRVIYQGSQFLFRSPDGGKTWERLSEDLTYNDPSRMNDVSFQAIAVLDESPLKFGLIYAATDDGRVHMTKNHGDDWIEITAGLPYGKHASRVTASAFDEGTVYLALNGKRDDDFAAYVYSSIDYGTTWTDIGKSLPGGPVNVIREDPKNQDVLYVGTDLGVYVSTNRGASWSVLGGNLPTTYVHDLVIHPRDGILVIATHGRGLWAIGVKSLKKKEH